MKKGEISFKTVKNGYTWKWHFEANKNYRHKVSLANY